MKYAFFAVATLLAIAFFYFQPEVEVSNTSDAIEEPTSQKILTLEITKTSIKAQPKVKVEMVEEAMAQQLSDAAKAYEFNSKFPPYSKPLSADNWNLLNPRPFVPRTQKLDLGADVSGVLSLDSYVIHNDSPMEVKLTLTSIEPLSLPSIKASIPELQARTSLSLVNSESNRLEFVGTFSPYQLKSDQDGNYSLQAKIEVAGETQILSTQFKLVSTQAHLEDIGTAFVDGANLTIPTTFSSGSPGKYRLQANLFDQETLAPIAHVNETFNLNSGKTTVNLRVHATTLRLAGKAGPYTLSDFNLTKVSTAPGIATQYGASTTESFTVNGFDLSLYDNSQYSNPQNEERLKFLKSISANSSVE